MTDEPDYPNQTKPFTVGWALRTAPSSVELNARYVHTCGFIDGETLTEVARCARGFHHRWAYGLYGRREPFAGFTFETENGKVGVEFPCFVYSGLHTSGVEGEVVVCTTGEVSDDELEAVVSDLVRALPDMRPPQPPLGDLELLIQGMCFSI